MPHNNKARIEKLAANKIPACIYNVVLLNWWTELIYVLSWFDRKFCLHHHCIVKDPSSTPVSDWVPPHANITFGQWTDQEAPIQDKMLTTGWLAGWLLWHIVIILMHKTSGQSHNIFACRSCIVNQSWQVLVTCKTLFQFAVIEMFVWNTTVCIVYHAEEYTLFRTTTASPEATAPTTTSSTTTKTRPRELPPEPSQAICTRMQIMIIISINYPIHFLYQFIQDCSIPEAMRAFN